MIQNIMDDKVVGQVEKAGKMHVKLVMQDCDTGCYVTFEEYVEPTVSLGDWFDRIKRVCDQVFVYRASMLVIYVGPGGIGSNKIAAIKTHRALTGVGLREAKDAIEGIYGGQLMVCAHGAAAERCVRELTLAGVDARIKRCSLVPLGLENYVINSEN